MELFEIIESQKSEYDRFVMENETGSFLQSWRWGEWQEQLGREVFRFWALDDNQKPVLGIQLVKMPLPFGKYYLYAPYGPVIGKSDVSEVRGWILGAIKEKFSDAVFIRIEPKYHPVPTEAGTPLLVKEGVKTTNIQPAKTLIIDLSRNEEQLLQEMHPKTRYNIKVAQKHGVEIKDEFDISVGHGLFAKEAVQLIAATALRQGFKAYGAAYYENLIDFFGIQNRGELTPHIYKAVVNNQLLAAAIMLDFGTTRTFLFGGSAEENKNVMAPYLLHWQAMLDAKAGGILNYDFWGIETSRGETPGFVRFKLGFGGQVKEYSGAYDIVNRPALYRVYKVFRYIHNLL